MCTAICPPNFHLTHRVILIYNLQTNFKWVLWLSSFFAEIRWRDFFFCTEGDIETNAAEGTEGGFTVLLNVGNQTSLQ